MPKPARSPRHGARPNAVESTFGEGMGLPVGSLRLNPSRRPHGDHVTIPVRVGRSQSRGLGGIRVSCRIGGRTGTARLGRRPAAARKPAGPGTAEVWFESPEQVSYWRKPVCPMLLNGFQSAACCQVKFSRISTFSYRICPI
jgi:hypothetical protein